MTTLLLSLSIAIIAIAGAIVFYVRKRMAADIKIQSAEKTIEQTIEAAKKEAQSVLAKAQTEAQEIISKTRVSLEDELKSRRQGVADIEKRVLEKEKYIDAKEMKLNEKDAALSQELESAKEQKKKQEEITEELSKALEKVAGFSKEEAEKILLSNVEKDARHRAGQMIKEMEDQARKIANRKAKEIVTDAIQRTAVDHVAAATTSVVQLPDDEMKGRIIGREGRNIRAFESATGVDVIIDDTPGAVVLSSFDPIRREVARIALDNLVLDGRIHPTRVEEAVDRAKKELQDIIREKGEAAADELGLKFHPKIIELLGKLSYRTSYGQNILAHSLEAAHIAAIMAQELGVNANLAKRGTILHDIGKAIDFEQQGTHVHLGEEICRKYGESEEVINCINAHHEEQDPDTIEAVIVMMADAISSARPGARRESVDAYVKRLEKLEAIANSFDGIEKSYAIQAGREVRVMVRPEQVDDPGAHKLALDIAKKIETEMDYPGEVRVSVIRQTRATGVAK